MSVMPVSKVNFCLPVFREEDYSNENVLFDIVFLLAQKSYNHLKDHLILAMLGKFLSVVVYLILPHLC